MAILTLKILQNIQFIHEFFLMLTTHVFNRITGLMYDTELNNRIKIYVTNDIRKILEYINISYKNVLYTTFINISLH